jgi:K+-transporting ATPase KdpF subunit
VSDFEKAGSEKERIRSMDYLIAGLISLALGIYLLYALLRPEKF